MKDDQEPILKFRETHTGPFDANTLEVAVNEDGAGPAGFEPWVEPGGLMFIIRDDDDDSMCVDITAEQEEELRTLLNARAIEREG